MLFTWFWNAGIGFVTVLAQQFYGIDSESFEVLLQQAAMMPEASRGIAFVKISWELEKGDNLAYISNGRELHIA
jgi:hypothetical protein